MSEQEPLQILGLTMPPGQRCRDGLQVWGTTIPVNEAEWALFAERVPAHLCALSDQGTTYTLRAQLRASSKGIVRLLAVGGSWQEVEQALVAQLERLDRATGALLPTRRDDREQASTLVSRG
jgi:hypothetical protein